MGVTVVSTTTASSADVVRLRASVSVSDAPNVTTVVQLPAAQIEYIDLTLNVVLDTRGFFKLLADAVAVADVLALTAQKLLSDSLLTADFRSLEPQKGLADSIGMTDTLTRTLVFLRNFADSVALADTQAKSFTLGTRRDFLFTLSEQAFEYEKFIPDGVAMNDSASLGDGSTYFFDKAIMNMAFVGDARASSLSKLVTDSTGVVDTTTRITAKGLSDTQGTTDVLSRVFAKVLADAAAMLDTPAISFTRPLSDNFGFTDTTLWSFAASRVESVSVPDSGFLRSQDYCDPTYFAEDYVGVSQSF